MDNNMNENNQQGYNQNQGNSNQGYNYDQNQGNQNQGYSYDQNQGNQNQGYNYNQNYDPNQGFKPSQGYGYDPNGIVPQPQGDNMALASMICGILSIIFCCCYGIVSIGLAIAAIIFYVKSKELDGGVASSMATVGLITGIIGAALGVVCVIYFVLVFFGTIVSAI